MNVHQLWLKQIVNIAMILMMGVSMSACSGSMSWKEEVKLHDGQVIISERYYNLAGFAYLDSSERTPLDETVTFTLPGTNKKITWKNDFRDSVPEQNSLNHFRFDIVNSVPYLATYPAGCISYNKWGRPNPPQILFKYAGDQWKRITLAELPPELIGMTANVIVGRPASSLLKSFYAVADVNAKNAPISTVEYKTILREALPKEQINQMCMEMVLYKGSWVMPNDQIARKLIDAEQKRAEQKNNSTSPLNLRKKLC